MKRKFLNMIHLSPETNLSVAVLILLVTSAAMFHKGPTEVEENHYLTSQSLKEIEKALPITEATKPVVIERAIKIGELAKKISLLKHKRRDLWKTLSRVSEEDSQSVENLKAFEAVQSLNEEISLLSGKMLNDLKEARAHES